MAMHIYSNFLNFLVVLHKNFKETIDFFEDCRIFLVLSLQGLVMFVNLRSIGLEGRLSILNLLSSFHIGSYILYPVHTPHPPET